MSKINLSYVAARERATGKILFLVEVSHLTGGGQVAQVAHTAAKFRAPDEEGAELRKKYSHLLVVIDNVEREAYEFPDPAKAHEEKILNSLIQAQHAAEQAGAAERRARQAVADAKQAAAAKKEADARVESLKQELAKIAEESQGPENPEDSGKSEDKDSEKSKNPEGSENIPHNHKELAKLSDEQLAKVAEQYDIKMSKDRHETIRAILKAAGE